MCLRDTLTQHITTHCYWDNCTFSAVLLMTYLLNISIYVNKQVGVYMCRCN